MVLWGLAPAVLDVASATKSTADRAVNARVEMDRSPIIRVIYLTLSRKLQGLYSTIRSPRLTYVGLLSVRIVTTSTKVVRKCGSSEWSFTKCAPSPGGQLSGMVSVPSHRPPSGLPHGQPWAELNDVGWRLRRGPPTAVRAVGLQQIDGMALSKHRGAVPGGGTSGAHPAHDGPIPVDTAWQRFGW